MKKEEIKLTDFSYPKFSKRMRTLRELGERINNFGNVDNVEKKLSSEFDNMTLDELKEKYMILLNGGSNEEKK